MYQINFKLMHKRNSSDSWKKFHITIYTHTQFLSEVSIVFSETKENRKNENNEKMNN